MGTKGREIVGMDVDQLLKLLTWLSRMSGSLIISTGSAPRS